MIVKIRYCFFLLSFSLFYSNYAFAVTLLIGDVDGFGFTSPDSYQSAQNGLADTNRNGIIEPGEYLPDLDGDGHVHVGGHDEFDNRLDWEKVGANGAKWTDVSLENRYNGLGRYPADNVEFIFDFIIPIQGQVDYGADHFINLVFGDYDVSPASLDIDGTTINLTTQSGRQDGLVQLAYASIPWASMLDGQVIIEMNAPSEPYVAIDYAYLHTAAQPAPLTTVAEPTTLLLAGLGLLGLGFVTRRKEQYSIHSAPPV